MMTENKKTPWINSLAAMRRHSLGENHWSVSHLPASNSIPAFSTSRTMLLLILHTTSYLTEKKELPKKLTDYLLVSKLFY